MSTNDPNLPESQPPTPRRRGRPVEMDALYGRLQETAPVLAKTRTNSAGIKLVLLPEATFQMGSTLAEQHHRLNEGPLHEVILTQSFYIGIHPVTQEQYQRVMGKNPARFGREAGGGPDHPVEQASWEDAVLFCRKLSDAERSDGLTYRLPTEAEWEHACRAGTSGLFSVGDALTSAQANINGDKTSRVGTYTANNFGLFDMHGNVWEWCADWYGEAYYRQSPQRDPQGPAAGEMRVVRGGSWRSQASSCRAAYRNALVPHNRDPYTGFRVMAVMAPLG